MGTLKDKYAVVTGAGKGIGRAIVERFLEDEVAGVAILEMDLALSCATAKELDPTGERVIAVRCDVSKQDNVHEAFQTVFEKFGRVDILVNNAGITRDAMFHKMDGKQWDQVISINLNGLFYCCRHVVPLMREQNYGKIVNVSSSSAHGNVGQANYSATKAGIEGFTKTLARELSSRNITVNAVAPSMIDTDMLRAMPEKVLAGFLQSSPARRLGSVDEVASVVLFLSGDDSSYVNGTVLPINGGMFT